MPDEIHVPLLGVFYLDPVHLGLLFCYIYPSRLDATSSRLISVDNSPGSSVSSSVNHTGRNKYVFLETLQFGNIITSSGSEGRDVVTHISGPFWLEYTGAKASLFWPELTSQYKECFIILFSSSNLIKLLLCSMSNGRRRSFQRIGSILE